MLLSLRHVTLLALLALGPPAAAEVMVHRVAVDAAGRVAIADLCTVMLRESGSAVKVSEEAMGGRVRVLGAEGALVLTTWNLTLGALGVTLGTSPEALLIHVDRAALRAHVDGLDEALRALFTDGDAPVFALDPVPGSDPRGPPVVLIHGLDSSPASLDGAGKALGKAGYDVRI
ncbi:MAG: hypothetical protein QF464_21990, partial [Myxococcota bacterium]|nr:hypothetical protein [Myxococcota bacterium]